MRILLSLLLLALVACEAVPAPVPDAGQLHSHREGISGLWAGEGPPPAGALTVADNVVLMGTGIVGPRRGFDVLNAEGFAETINATIEFKGALVAHTGTERLRYSTDNGVTWTDYPGSYRAPSTGGRIRFWEASGTLYFLTAAGVFELVEPTASPRLTGVAQAMPGSLQLRSNATYGWLPANTRIAYQVAWEYEPVPGRVQVGAFSERFIVTSAAPIVVPAANVRKVSEFEVRVSRIGHGFVTGDRVIVTLGGSELLLGGGTFAVTRIDDDLFSYEDNVSAGGSGTADQPVTYAFAPRDVRVTVPVPDAIPEGSRVRVYRSAPSPNAATEPPAGMRLLNVYGTSGTSFLLSDYNPGPLPGPDVVLQPQQSTRPPAGGEAASWGGVTFIADLQAEQASTFRFSSVFGIEIGKTLFALRDLGTPKILFPGTEERDVYFKLHSGGTDEENVRNTAQSFVRSLNRQYGEWYTTTYLAEEGGLPGRIRIEAKGDLDVPFDIVAINGPGPRFDPPLLTSYNGVHLRRENSFVWGTTQTAHGWSVGQRIVKTNHSADFPAGEKIITAVHPTTFEYIEAGPWATGTGAFVDNVLDASSTSARTPGGLAWSLPEASWVVPGENRALLGDAGLTIQRLVPTPDRLLVFTGSGLYQVVGTAPDFNISLVDASVKLPAKEAIATFGDAVYAFTPGGVAEITESVRLVSGPIQSHLANLLELHPTAVASRAFAVPYESERRVLFWFPEDSESALATQAYVFHVDPEQWTRWSVPATTGWVHSTEDRLYLGATVDGAIWEERKTLTPRDQRDGEEAIEAVVEWAPFSPAGATAPVHLQSGDLNFLEANFVSGAVQLSTDVAPTPSAELPVGPPAPTPSAAELGFSVPMEYRPASSQWGVRFTHAAAGERFRLDGVTLQYRD